MKRTMKPSGEPSERIIETIVGTADASGDTRLTPLGARQGDGFVVLAPYAPSKTLDNLSRSGEAVVNLCDDARVYAGCLTGHVDWPLTDCGHVSPRRLRDAATHMEVKVERRSDDNAERPAFYCRVVHVGEHAPFRGFNRAQAAVLEGAILLSRVHRLPAGRIADSLRELGVIVDKTAGGEERMAWRWLLEGFAKAGHGGGG